LFALVSPDVAATQSRTAPIVLVDASKIELSIQEDDFVRVDHEMTVEQMVVGATQIFGRLFRRAPASSPTHDATVPSPGARDEEFMAKAPDEAVRSLGLLRDGAV